MSRMDHLLDACPEQMTSSDVAELLGVSEQTVVRWLRTNSLPGFRLPRGWLIMREDLREYLHRAYNMNDTRGSAHDSEQDTETT